jgi:hypothetical protein
VIRADKGYPIASRWIAVLVACSSLAACGQADEIERFTKDGGYKIGRGSLCNRPEINPLASDLNMLLSESISEQREFRRIQQAMLAEGTRAANDVANRRIGCEGIESDLKRLADDVARRRAK